MIKQNMLAVIQVLCLLCQMTQSNSATCCGLFLGKLGHSCSEIAFEKAKGKTMPTKTCQPVKPAKKKKIKMVNAYNSCNI